VAGYRVSIVGATGAVGRCIVAVLEERGFPVRSLNLFASSRTAGTTIPYRGDEVEVRDIALEQVRDCDICFFCATNQVSREMAPVVRKSGAVVIDKSSVFRLDPEVPLVVPEVNPGAVDGHKGIIASPNCSTIQLVVAVKPIYDLSRIRRIWAATYQSVSGTGHEAIDELREQTATVLSNGVPVPRVYPRRIAFNIIPHIDSFAPSGYTGEEMKLISETKKILNDEGIRITATAARVPVFYCHSEAVTVETEEKLSVSVVVEALRRMPGVVVSDEANGYHTPVECAGRDDIYVSRVREDIGVDNGISMWIVGDNLRKGAATNAVQIAELLMARGLI